MPHILPLYSSVLDLAALFPVTLPVGHSWGFIHSQIPSQILKSHLCYCSFFQICLDPLCRVRTFLFRRSAPCWLSSSSGNYTQLSLTLLHFSCIQSSHSALSSPNCFITSRVPKTDEMGPSERLHLSC